MTAGGVLAGAVRGQLWKPGDPVELAYIGGVFESRLLLARAQLAAGGTLADATEVFQRLEAGRERAMDVPRFHKGSDFARPRMVASSVVNFDLGITSWHPAARACCASSTST